MSAHSKRFPLLKDEEQGRRENETRREILQKIIMSDPRFGGWRIDWPDDGKGKMAEGPQKR
jgi:hypothetical protein